MGNFYLKSPEGEQLEDLKPKKETIKFLLNYSKALRITKYRNLQFELLLN